jgi:hypothetical protein
MKRKTNLKQHRVDQPKKPICARIFKVTRDFIDHGRLNGKYFVPRDVSDEQYQRRIKWFDSVPKVLCRLLDGDNNIYFHIQMPECLLDIEDGGEMAAYPLEGWAMPAYGCVTMDLYDATKKKFVPFI